MSGMKTSARLEKGTLPRRVFQSAFCQAATVKHDQNKRHKWLPTLHIARRIVVAIIGGTVTLVGIALIVLPGPAFIVIPIGLSILATEFLWARRWLNKIRRMADELRSKPPERKP